MLPSMNQKAKELYALCLGRVIVGVFFVDNELIFVFDNDKSFTLFDNGQSCCEHRYMHTDDELSFYVGACLLGIEIASGPAEGEAYDGDCKESEFLKIMTTKGSFTVVAYNEHNGYYGGFSLSLAETP